MQNENHTVGLGAMMAGGNPDAERGRADNDFYATPPPVTAALFDAYRHRLHGATIWEPCAGDGTMARTLLNRGAGHVACTDLHPQPSVDPRVKIGTLDLLRAVTMPKVHAVVTNPPFDVAEPMIRRLMTLDGGPPPFLALMLKATYWHAAGRSEMFAHYTPTAVHPLTWRPDFKNLGRPTMEVMWCVWDSFAPMLPDPAYRPLHHPRDAAGKKDLMLWE